ncbi:MAG: glycosyltransferase [Candidatus Altiarchaeales archaeon]|nr:glycosyltransferase [Candidatus Altiarchaeales archaeon]
MKNKKESSWILYMGTYPPRECGIATFTRDLAKAMNEKFNRGVRSKILAINNDETSIYNYPKEVIFQVNDTDVQGYIEIAEKINETDSIKLISIQHEFGIFGGEYGNHLISFLETVSKPVVTTFHTVLPNPNPTLRSVVNKIAQRSAGIVVMTNRAVGILRNDYGLTKKDIVVIPHGIPAVPFDSNTKKKKKIGYEDRLIISSFGMMNPGKGYEYVIESLPAVIEGFPNLLYLIIGETHPVVRKREGEHYRNFLERKVKKLGLEKHVKFYNKYVNLSEIIDYLKATDVYVSSSTDPNQIVSGTLSYAMGCGRVVVSTPTLHAKEAVNPERGILLDEFNNPKLFASSIIQILSNPSLKEAMEKNAYAYTRHVTWPNVALSYLTVFERYIGVSEKYGKLPKIKLRHLTTLTDDFGIIQFADHAKPDPQSGYCLDDNARAMIVCSMHYNIFKSESTLKLIKIYLDYMKYVQQKDGGFYNFVDINREINHEHWSEDSHGRALWSLGYLISRKKIPYGLRNEAEEMFNKALKHPGTIRSPRAVAFSIIGLYFYNKVKPSPVSLNKIKELANYLVSLYKTQSSDKWLWFEEYLTYSNSKLPESLFYAYLATDHKRYLEIAETTLEFLSSITFIDGKFTPIGQDGWYFKNGHRAHFDQQPVDAASMVQTLVLANKTTKNGIYQRNAITAFNWFLGDNPLNQVIYDESTGGCHDGLGDSSINLNQGAESTISYLIARLSITQ